jgi:hypothetical protein
MRFRDRELGRDIAANYWQARGEEVIEGLGTLGVFFYRGDTLGHGEGSSGVPWLGEELFAKVLDRLVDGGLVVTDGSNWSADGPRPLATFYEKLGIGDEAVARSEPFAWGGRRFCCVAYVGERYGPTLVWQVTRAANE